MVINTVHLIECVRIKISSLDNMSRLNTCAMRALSVHVILGPLC